MIIHIDLESMPEQGTRESYIKESKENFKAPSSLTKTKALEDMGMCPVKNKYMTKDDAIKLWEKEMAPIMAESVGEEQWRKTTFDGSKGQVFSIAYAIDDEPVQVIYEKSTTGEKSVLERFASELRKRLTLKGSEYQRAPFFVGHNIKGYDLRFLYHRYVCNGINPGFSLAHNGRHGIDFFDTMVEWAGFNGSISQDALCKCLGISGKPDDIDGSKVWDHINAGMYDKVAEYNIDDVEKVREIYKHLTFKEMAV